MCRGSLYASLFRWLHGVNSQFLVAQPRFGGGTPAIGQREHPQDPHAIVERKGNDAAGANFLARLVNALAVDAYEPAVDDGLGKRATFHQPDALQVAVDSHFFSFASSANAWDGAVRRSSRCGRRPRQRQASPVLVKPTSFISSAIAASSRPTEVAKSRSTGLSPRADRTLRAWLASRSARSMRIQSRPSRR